MPDDEKPKRQLPKSQGGNLCDPWTSETRPRGGRRKGEASLLEALQQHLRQHPEEVHEVAVNLLRQAKGGGKAGATAVRAIAILFDRLDGPVTEVVEHRIEQPPQIVGRERPQEPMVEERTRAAGGEPEQGGGDGDEG